MQQIELRDYIATKVTGVDISYDGKKLWVCIDGQCVLRIKSPKIILSDNRKGLTCKECCSPMTKEDYNKGNGYCYDCYIMD